MGSWKDLIPLLNHLIPGFFAAWIYYSLTAHEKADAFERVIEALIFTTLIQVIVVPLQWLLLTLGNVVVLGNWTETSRLAISVVIAIVLGIGAAWASNHDLPHSWLREWGWTKRTSYPSDWYAAFDSSPEPQWVVLHLNSSDDDAQLTEPPARRLFGCVASWPDYPEDGHFVLLYPQWQKNDGTRQDVGNVLRMIIRAADVRWVEILVPPGFELPAVREESAGDPSSTG